MAKDTKSTPTAPASAPSPVPAPDAPPAAEDPTPASAAPAEPETTRGGKLKQAWTDDATGQTYMPGEKVEGEDGD